MDIEGELNFLRKRTIETTARAGFEQMSMLHWLDLRKSMDAQVAEKVVKQLYGGIKDQVMNIEKLHYEPTWL